MEAIRILKPGKYELDLVHLFKNDPLVYKVGEGKYIIDLIRSFSPSKKI
jgi:predicted  nucleic acid-binding Zn-ribbon protein